MSIGVDQQSDVLSGVHDGTEHKETAPTAARERAQRLALAADRRKVRKLARAAIPVPTRDRIYDGHSHSDLRATRALLVAEETRVSYWRRIIQGRLDIVRAGTHEAHPVADLSRVLTDAPGAVSRLASIDVHPVDDLEPLPNLSELWSRQTTPTDTTATQALLVDLGAAEAQLSTHRANVHHRLDLVTRELIARYREQPTLALTILPVDHIHI